MTLHDVGLIFNHWRRSPPLRSLVTIIAVALGVPVENFTGKKDEPGPDQQKGKYMTAEEFARMMQVTGGKIEGIGQWG